MTTDTLRALARLFNALKRLCPAHPAAGELRELASTGSLGASMLTRRGNGTGRTKPDVSRGLKRSYAWLASSEPKCSEVTSSAQRLTCRRAQVLASAGGSASRP